MKKRIGFKTLKSRLIFWFLLVALIPLIAVSTVISLQRTRVIKENAFHKLTAIRDLKVDQVNNWIDERISDLRAVSNDKEIRALGEALNEKATEKNIHIIQDATDLLNHYVATYKAYEELLIISPVTGKIELSTDKSRIGTDKSRDTYFTEPIRTGEVYIKDIYYSKTIHRPSMTFSIPIYGEGESIVGVLVARIDLEHSLYELLLERAGMGNTGETLLVNEDVVALNALRWYADAPLKLSIKARPAVMASQGKTGITETPDYRNEEVLAAYTFIPRTKWGFVAKQDLKEIYAPVQAMFVHILIVVLISAVVVYFLAAFVARIFARPVLEMTETSRRIQEGDLTARNRIESNDEFGYLADSFNNLADSMGSQIQVQSAVAHVSDTMVAAKDITGLAGQLLKTLLDTTGSNMGVFYLLASDGARFDHCASIGVTPELLEPFDASAAEGELGKAALTREISHIKEIPEDTIFTFRTFTGTVLPKEMITVPLFIDEKVAGVISLAALQPYSKEAVDILNQIWPGINTALSNLFAGEETRKLADELLSKNQELEAQTEEALGESETRYRELVENAVLGIFQTTREGKFLVANQRMADIFGYDSQQHFLADVDNIINLYANPEERPIVLQEIDENGYIDGKEGHFKRKDGSPIFCNAYVRSIQRKNGETIYEGLLEDITDKKRMEAQLQHANKMEAIGTLAGGVAHEFNNALMGVMGNIELLKMDLPEDERRAKYFETMNESGHRMSRLTDQLLAYAQGGKYQARDLKLDDFVIETLPILQHDLNPEVRIETHFSKVSYIRADHAQMQMVLSAIVVNSNEAIEGKGLIRIAAENKDVDEDFTKQHPGLKPGPYVCFTIEDDGTGMDEETRSGIFEPFFTTKFQGRGMGMAAVYGIIKGHDGTITVESEPGKGTVVRIYLPAISVESRQEAKAVKQPEAEIAMGEGTILIIEDEELLVGLFREILERLGYRALLARTGKEAVELAKTFDGQIDLALLDIKLPDMDGGRVYPLIM